MKRFSLGEALRSSMDSIRELVVIYVIMVTVVAALFMLFEGKDIFMSYYWTFITGLTIGYGDIYPVTVLGRILAVVWGHFMVFMFGPIAVGYVVINMIKNKDAYTDEEQKEHMRLLRKAAGEEK